MPEPIVTAGEPSRLPAGSTLLVNGIHVAHPHAEVNLPGQPDPRLGDTKAVTEYAKTEHDGEATLVQDPLHDSVKPKVVTTANVPALKQVEFPQTSPETAKPADAVLAVEQPTLLKTV